jgi:hypothetical protein
MIFFMERVSVAVDGLVHLSKTGLIGGSFHFHRKNCKKMKSPEQFLVPVDGGAALSWNRTMSCEVSSATNLAVSSLWLTIRLAGK